MPAQPVVYSKGQRSMPWSMSKQVKGSRRTVPFFFLIALFIPDTGILRDWLKFGKK